MKTHWYVLLDRRNVQVVELTEEGAKEACVLGPFPNRSDARRSQNIARRANEGVEKEYGPNVDYRTMHEGVALMLADGTLQKECEQTDGTEEQIRAVVKRHLDRLLSVAIGE